MVRADSLQPITMLRSSLVSSLLCAVLPASLSAQSLLATAAAASQLEVRAGANTSTLPFGTDLTSGVTLTESSNFPGQTANASFVASLAAGSGIVTLNLDESASVTPVLGVSASTGPHQTRLLLNSATPASGLLRVRYERSGTGALPTSSASIDLDGDGQPEWNAPLGFGVHHWSTPFVVSGPTAVFTTTETTASFISSNINALLTVEFVRIARAVLPDDAHLSGSRNQTTAPASDLWWSDDVAHFQILYEASHLLDAGLSGPVTLQRLVFRGQDGVPDPGGRSWAGVQVRVGSTSLAATQLSSNFASNTNAATMGPQGTTNIVELPSSGSTPNDDLLLLDLGAAGASIVHDPTGAAPNLLIDIIVPNAAFVPSGGSAMMDLQVTEGTAAQVRGGGVYVDSATAATGTLSDHPPVVALEFTGAGGHESIVPARNRYFGAACGGQAKSFFQDFLAGQAIELPAGLTLTPDFAPAPFYYDVTAGAPPVDLTKLLASPTSTADDELLGTPISSFATPAGTFGWCSVSTNGYVMLGGPGSSSGVNDPEWEPRPSTLLGSDPRFAPLWLDLDCGANAALDPLAGLHVFSDTVNQESWFTWYRCGRYGVAPGTHADWTFQCHLDWVTGVVEFRYGNLPEFSGLTAGPSVYTPTLVGWSPGDASGVPSVDPDRRDLLLETPFTTSPYNLAGHPILIPRGSPDDGGAYYGSRLHPGNLVTWDTYDVPVGSYIGGLFLDTVASRPGLHVPGLFAPGCALSLGTAPLLHEVFLTTQSSHVGTLPVTVPTTQYAALLGSSIYAQFLVLDLSGTGPLLIAASAAVQHTIGLQ